MPIHIDSLDSDRLIGAHYYPWYGDPRRAGWPEESPSEPVLGEYSVEDPEVIDQHLKWCLEAGIEWLSVSWWGPDSYADEVLSEHLLSAERFADIQFSVIYESTGPFHAGAIDMDSERNRHQLREDFEYLAETFFDEPNYLHIDDRPVVFLYLGFAFQGDVAGAFEEAAEAAGVTPYVLADIEYGDTFDTLPILDVADGITAYNPYPAVEDADEVFEDHYRGGLEAMHLATNVLGTDFFPVALPGYNDTLITHVDREPNPVLESSPERYERVCEWLQPHLADAEAVLVTSFNEWYEDTQIEPNETVGTGYLDLTADYLATGQSEGFEPDGAMFTFEWGQTRSESEINSDIQDGRELAFRCNGLSVTDTNETAVAEVDVGSPESDLRPVRGVYPQESHDGRTWRWFGGPKATTDVFVHGANDIDRLELSGSPIEDLSVTVYAEGQTGEATLSTTASSHIVDLSN